jgi:hypothetical protein
MPKGIGYGKRKGMKLGGKVKAKPMRSSARRATRRAR